MLKGRVRLQRTERFCARCEDVKPLQEFSTRSGGYCKPCHRAYTKVWQAQRKQKAA